MENNGDDAAVSDEHAELVELSIAWLRRSDELGFFDEASNRYLLATFDSFQQLQYHEFVQGVLSRPIDAVPEADSESVENDSSDQ